MFDEKIKVLMSNIQALYDQTKGTKRRSQIVSLVAQFDEKDLKLFGFELPQKAVLNARKYATNYVIMNEKNMQQGAAIDMYQCNQHCY